MHMFECAHSRREVVERRGTGRGGKTLTRKAMLVNAVRERKKERDREDS